MSTDERLAVVETMLAECRAILEMLAKQQACREWYSVDEFAAITGKAAFTCREYARLGRIRAEKKSSGRGAPPSWAISHAESIRFQKEGLLPLKAG